MAGEPTLGTHNARLVFAWTIIFLALSLLATVGRLYSRYMKGARYGVDDYLLVSGTVVYFVQGVLVFIAIFKGGVGHLVSNLENPERKLATLFKLVTFIQYPFGISMGLIRASLLALILRLFAMIAGKRFRILVWITLTITIGQVLYVVLNASFLCRPFEANWDKTILSKDPKASCRDSTTSFVVVAAWGIFCDVLIFFLPIPQTIKLVMGKRQRTLLFIVFGLGIADIIVGAFRIAAVFNSRLADPNTVTVNVAQGIIWGMAEPSIAIMVVCGPPLWHLLDKWTGGGLRTTMSSFRRSAKSTRRIKSSSHGDSYRQMDDQLELVTLAQQSSREPSAQTQTSINAHNIPSTPLNCNV